MEATFQLFGLTGYAYGLCAALAALTLLAAAGLLGYRRRLPAGTVRVFGLIGLPLAIIGARALYCAVNWSTFAVNYENPLLALRFFDGGLSLPGALGGLLIAAALTARMMNVRAGRLMDVLAAPMALAVAVLRFGEQFTDLGAGKAVEEGFATACMPWLFVQSRMGVLVEYRMNVWAYEAAAALVICLATLLVYRALGKSKNARHGDAMLFFLTLYGAFQLLLESLRDDGHMLIIFLRIGQVAAAAMCIAVCVILTLRYVHIRTRADARVWLTWAGMLACMATIVLLEFSLDGRLGWAPQSMGRDYAIMAVACAGMFALPCSLLFTLNRSLYRQEHIAVRIDGDHAA